MSSFRIIQSIDGRPASSHFTASVRTAGGGWSPAYVLQTTSRNASGAGGCGYFGHLNNWTASWLSFELAPSTDVEVLVQRTSAAITRAIVKPPSAAARVVAIGAEGARLLIHASARFHLDLDGGLDETNTGPDYHGGAVHTFSVFAEPLDPSPPQPGQQGVYWVRAGDLVPAASALPANVTTLAFGPGVHRVARNPDGWAVYTLPHRVLLQCAGGTRTPSLQMPSELLIPLPFGSNPDR